MCSSGYITIYNQRLITHICVCISWVLYIAIRKQLNREITLFINERAFFLPSICNWKAIKVCRQHPLRLLLYPDSNQICCQLHCFFMFILCEQLNALLNWLCRSWYVLDMFPVYRISHGLYSRNKVLKNISQESLLKDTWICLSQILLIKVAHVNFPVCSIGYN